MSSHEYDDTELIYPDDNEDEDFPDTSLKGNVNLAFKECIVKKLKPTKELIESLPFVDISYIHIKDGSEGYLRSYSTIDYLMYKFSQAKSLGKIAKIDIYNVNPQMLIEGLFRFNNIPFNSYSHAINKTNGNLKVDEVMLGVKDEHDNNMLLYVEYSVCSILYYKNYNGEENLTLQKLLGILENYTEPKINKNKIFVVHKSQHGFDKTGFTIKKVNINLAENYNEDFPKIAQDIVTGLNKKNKTNLVILSGCPGSGKTTFIRYMASRLKKNIIFISPDMVSYITDPSFIPFLIKNNDSILIIEDAEPALETRDTGRTGAVSNILNLTDGLLSDCLNISIVATFNTESNRIDSALLRKGRLLKNYKFEKLAIDKSKSLLKKLGHDVEVKEPMSLSDIYYYETDNNAPDTSSHKKIAGFGKN